MTLPSSEEDEPTGSEPATIEPSAARERQSIVTSRRTVRALADGLQFGKYRIIRLIGIGGMSEIYEAVHVGLRKRVALKVMRRDLAESPEARQRFIAEGINAARLRHTNVVDVTDVGEVDELPFLVMNLLEGEDLGRVYDRQGRIPVAEIVDLLLPVAAAVALGHEKGVVHRDLKPDNIFLHREGFRVIPKVLDFGVSRVMNARRITLNSSVFGTPHYMSPEQARGGPTDARTDQYSLGVILYEGVTGTLPRDSSNPIELLHAVAYDSFAPPSEHFDVPAELEAVILRAMARDPDARFESMRELAMALVPFASEAAREYWSIELGLIEPERTSETRLPQVVRHPSPVPSPQPVVPLDRADRTGPLRKRGAELVITAPATTPAPGVPIAPRVLPPPPPPRAPMPVAQAQVAHAPPRVEPVELELHAARARRRRERLAWLLAAVLPLVAVGGLWIWKREPRIDPPATTALDAGEHFEVDVQANPASAELFLDGKQVAVGRYSTRLPRDGREHELQAAAQGFHPARVRFRDHAPPKELLLERLAPPIAPAPTPPDGAPLKVAKAAAARAQRAAAPAEALAPDARTPTGEASSARVAPKVATIDESAYEDVPEAPQPGSVDAPAPNPRIAVVEAPRPNIRLVDEDEPQIQLVE